MTVITDSAALAALCHRLSGEVFVTVDTEFMRDRTYWPDLCLVQVAGTDEAAGIDPMADGIDLAPLLELLANPQVLKVFHAARQDLEIFFQLMGRLPTPLFDSQVAAMVCGFGDSVSYETLAARLAGARIDKSFRFTDWAKRPLSERQITYALGDVTHLRPIYQKLSKRLHASGRERWVDEEMAILTDPATYRLDPETAWMRLKPRSGSPKFLNVLKEVAAWRETEAQRRNLPRNRLVRDEALLEIAAQAPDSVAELSRTRGMSRGTAEGVVGEGLLAAVARGLARPPEAAPTLVDRPEVPPGRGPLIDLLKVLLKLRCEAHHVAQKLVANTADLEAIACSDEAPVPALQGWRREVFGADALALKQGRLALTAARDGIRVVRLES
ncbi:MAG: ribonuclease D [Proteobacteria bacterium]|nr:ribonuclease D [Pseudomonadota bacterium]